MLIHNAVITGSLTYNGVDISDITGSEASISALNSFSASMLNYTASNNLASASFSTRVVNLESTASVLTTASASFAIVSQSYASASGSLSTRVTNTETTASSLVTASGSFSTRVTNLELTGSSLVAASASFSTRVVSLESTASVLTTASASFAVVSSSYASASGSLSTRVTTIEGSYATTGSNVFVGNQGITSLSNAISFTSTGSLYTDGGLRITKDMYVSGTAFFNNVTIYGTQSVNYITSSQLNIGTNIITVNTDTPTVRYGGIAVYDSGSTGLTGSLLWDSEQNHWIYTNPSGSTYSGGMMISGPRASARGCEVGTTSCALMMGQGGDHITSSAILHYGNATCFYGTSIITSTGVGCFSGAVCASSVASAGTITGTSGAFSSTLSSNSDFTVNTNRFIVNAATGNTSVAGTLNVTGQACASSVLSSGTICSTGNTCFGGMSVVASCLGIGTATPNQKLQVYDATVARILVGTNTTFTDPYSGFPAQNISAIQVISSNVGGAQLQLGYTNTCSGCGIGGIHFMTTGTSASEKRGALIASELEASSATNVTANLVFYTNITGTIGERMRIASTGQVCFACTICAPMVLASGCVGIGTTSPYQNLQVYQTGGAGNNYVEGTIQVGGTSSILGAALSYAAQNSGYVNLVNLNTSGGANARISIGFGAISSGLPASTVMTLNQSGYVGIGTCTPTRALDMCGVLRVQTAGSSGAPSIELGVQNQGSGFFAPAANTIAVATNDNERLRITSTGIACFACQVCAPMVLASGCVGINITDPLTRLHVQFAGTTTTTCMACLKDGALVLYNANAGSSTNGTVGIFGQNAGALGLSSGIGFSRESSGDWGTQLRFYTHPTTTTEIDVVCERMRITGDGDIAIGSSSTRLSGGSTCSTFLTLTAKASGANALLELNGIRTSDGEYSGYVRFFNNSGATPIADIQAIRGSSDTIGTLAIATSGTERMRITSTGIACFACQVCAPQVRAIGCEHGLFFQRTTGTSADLYSWSSDSGAAYLYNHTTSCILMLFAEGGNVGIGTSNPQKTLEIRTGGSNTTPSQIFNGAIVQAIVAGEPMIAFSSNISPSAGIPTASELARAGIGFHYVSDTLPSEFSIGIQCTNVCNSNVRFFNGVERLRITSTGIACFACQVCAPRAIFTNCVGILQTSIESPLDIGNESNQAAWSSCTSCDANLGENFENNIIIQAQHAPGANCAYGYPASNLVFRASNTGNAIWNLGAIQAVVDPFGGSNYQGGLVFLTKPTSNSCDPVGRKTQGGPLVPILALGQNASNTRIAYFNSNVGIGTGSPSDRLTVTDASTYTFNVGAASGGAGAVLYTLGSAALTFATCGSSNERMRITSGGCVIVNGTSASSIMTIYPAAGSADTLTYRTTGNSAAGALYAYSDGNGPSSGILHNVSITCGGGTNRFNGSFSGWTIAFDSRPASDTMTFNYVNTSGTYITRISLAGNGITCFACQVCAKSLWFSSNTTGQITFGSNDACNAYVVSDSNNALYLGNNNSYKIFVPNDGADMIFRTSPTYGNPCERMRITSGGNILPGANGTQDLGSSSLRWCTVYTSDLSLNNGIGDYTIVEGENDLFLYNNKQCKVYKFVVQEVCPEIAPAKRSI